MKRKSQQQAIDAFSDHEDDATIDAEDAKDLSAQDLCSMALDQSDHFIAKQMLDHALDKVTKGSLLHGNILKELYKFTLSAGWSLDDL